MNVKNAVLFVGLLLFSVYLPAQERHKLQFLEIPDSLHQTRFWTLNTAIAGSYVGTMSALSIAWYQGYERSPFHFFDDGREWRGIDKSGHIFTAYFESRWTRELYRWTGVEDRKAVCLGAAGGMIFQAGIEVLDGFSAKWGFSTWDIVANMAGSATFLTQELLWQEQRISLKLSSHLPRYDRSPIMAVNSTETTTLKDRAADLYGTSIPEIVLKEYNGLTLWASANISSFIRKKDTRFPKWLNVAVGYSAENVFGGFENEWTDAEGNYFVVDAADYPRYSQFIIAPDVDFTRIRTNKKGLKLLFGLMNVIKVPLPALELNTQGKVRFHAVYF